MMIDELIDFNLYLQSPVPTTYVLLVPRTTDITARHSNKNKALAEVVDISTTATSSTTTTFNALPLIIIEKKLVVLDLYTCFFVYRPMLFLTSSATIRRHFALRAHLHITHFHSSTRGATHTP
jgi:hypothetical protein